MLRTAALRLALSTFSFLLLAPAFSFAAEEQAAQIELPTLITASPAEGYALAIRLARLGVAQTQPDKDLLKRERPQYAQDAEGLIAASRVIAIHFQTIAAANGYWNDGD